MVTYSVRCGACRSETLFEKAEPLADPGTLPAFCSDACSVAFFRDQVQCFVDNGHPLIEMPCGCLALVFGPGSTFPWLVCEAAKGDSYSTHSNDVHKGALLIWQRAGQDDTICEDGP